MNERQKSRALRREIGQYTWALLIYYLILNIAVSTVCEIDLLYRSFQAVIEGNNWQHFETAMMDAMEKVFIGNAWGYLLACAVAVALIPVWKGKRFFAQMYSAKQDMTWDALAGLVCLMLLGQLLFQLVAVVEEAIANLFGLSVLEAMEMASAGADTLSMFLYMGFGAPIVEEIVFRGVIMRGLEPYGKRFAILASAVLFGLFHGNLVQSPYAFAVGLVFGYTAMEYSIAWAMVLHMLNNLVLGDMLVRLTSFLPQGADELAQWCVILGASIGAVVILIRKRRQIRAYHGASVIDRSCLKAFFLSVPNILLTVLMLLNAFLMLFL